MKELDYFKSLFECWKILAKNKTNKFVDVINTENEEDEFLKHYNVIEKKLKDIEELDKHLDFSNGALMSCFDYKGQQIVAMPLKEYEILLKSLKK